MPNDLVILVELGVPAVLTVTLFFAPKLRPMCYSILGAITPFLFAYLSTFLAAQSSQQGNASHLLDTIWSMTFIPYCIALGVGLVLGFLAKPTNTAMRFSAASLASICCTAVYVWLA